jgi:diguanylate cyclase (GGDEF)-like protein
VRKRICIAGRSREGLSLIPLIEANPEVEICSILTDDREATLATLEQVGPGVREAYEGKITLDAEAVFRTQGLVAVIEADPPPAIRSVLEEAPDHGVQRTTPLVAKLLYAFGPVDAFRKPELLEKLGEILESYNLTIDRRRLLGRILQIAVGTTGANRGSLMLYDPEQQTLTVEVAIGIEKELIPKIRISPGDGIAGRAFQERRPLLLTGKADWRTYRITRERDDVESALSVPLILGDRVLGVLNLSHTKQRGMFTEEDLQFVEQLAQLDAKIIARAEEYHSLQRDSIRLRVESEVRRLLGAAGPLRDRLAAVCRFLAEEVTDGIAHVYMRDPDLDALVLQASSLEADPLASRLRVRASEGVIGWAARSGEQVVLCGRLDNTRAYYAALPLGKGESLLGVLTVESAHPESKTEDLVRESLDAAASVLAGELHDVLRELRMEREATRMGAINEAAARMNASRDSAEVARIVTSTTAMILEAEHAVLRLRDEASGRFQIRSYFGSAETDAQHRLLALENELAAEAVERNLTSRVSRLDEAPGAIAKALGITSAMVEPLSVGGRVLGTLSVLNHVGRDPLLGERFGPDDERALVRLGDQAARALGSVLTGERARHRERFDELTGLPNLAHLRDRLDEELARASARERSLALVQLRIVNLDEVLRDQEPAVADRLVVSLAQELRAALRDFDVPARTGAETFSILLPEPEGDVGELLGPLARRVRQGLLRELDRGEEEPLPLEFGYACFPEDGATARALEERATVTRIRTV